MKRDLPNPWAADNAKDVDADNPWKEDNRNQPGPVLAEWYEEPAQPPETGDKPKYLRELPPQPQNWRVEKNPATGALEYVEGKEGPGAVHAVFTDQPQAGIGGRVSARALASARPDTERLGKQAVAGGALQGFTFGAADELAAAKEAVMPAPTKAPVISDDISFDEEQLDPSAPDASEYPGVIERYRKERDANRRAFSEAESGAPGEYAKGNLIGSAASIVPLARVGTVASAAKVAQLIKSGKTAEEALAIARPTLLSPQNLALGGGLGAAQSAGESRADLTRGEVGPFALDVAKGGTIGTAATAGLGLVGKAGSSVAKWVRSAPERATTKADDALWQMITRGAGKTEREELAGVLGADRGAILDMARSNPAFMDAIQSGDKTRAARIVLAAQPEVAARKASTITGMEKGRRIELQPIVVAIERKADELRAIPTPENMALAKKWQDRADAIKEAWLPIPKEPLPPKIPALKGDALSSRLMAEADKGTVERAYKYRSDFGKVAEKYKLGNDVDNVAARQVKIDEALKPLNEKTAEIYDKAASVRTEYPKPSSRHVAAYNAGKQMRKLRGKGASEKEWEKIPWEDDFANNPEYSAFVDAGLNGEKIPKMPGQSVPGTINVSNVTEKLRGWADELRANFARSNDANAVEKEIARLQGVVETRGKPTMTAKELRQFITDAQGKAFSGSYIDPTEAKSMQRELVDRLRGILDEHVAKNASPATVEKLNKLNREISTLIAFKEAAENEAVKEFRGIYKNVKIPEPDLAIASPGTRNKRATVAQLYRLIQETSDPEAKKVLSEELYRQIGPESTSQLAGIEREESLLNRLGKVTSASADQQAGDAERGYRLTNLFSRSNRISAAIAKGGDAVADKANQVAVAIETLRRKGANNSALAAVGKMYGLSKEITEEIIRVTAPRKAASGVVREEEQ